MNAAAKELPVSYDLSKPQEDREPYVGSVLFFKHVIFTVTLLLILFGGLSIWAYIILWIVIPEEPARKFNINSKNR